MSASAPDLTEVLNRFRDRLLAATHVGTVARVERYDSSTQLADVKPLIRESVEQEDGTREETSVPVLCGVRIVMPGAGGLRILLPVTSGDIVWVTFADRGLDRWLAQGGESTPTDLRRHHLADAIAFPMAPHGGWEGAEAGVISIGSGTASSDYVALASLVTAQLDALKTAITNAVVVAGDGGASLKATILTALSSWPASVASATVKIRG